MEEFEGAGEALVGIFDAQRGGWDYGKVFGDDHGCGLGKPRCGRVLRIRHECDFSGAGLLDAV